MAELNQEIPINIRLAVESVADFDAIYNQYHRAVYANILKMVKQPETAEDILQEVFFTLWKSREKIYADKVAGWLFVVSYNKAATHLKKLLRLSFVELAEETIIEEAQEDPTREIYQEQLSLIENAIRHLPERKKEVLQLHYFEGRSHEEIAASLGISITSVKDYLKQSAGFIRKHTRGNYDGSLAAVASALLVFYLEMP